MAKIISIIKRHKLITGIIFVGLLVTLSYAFYFQVRVAVDAKAYDSIAWSLVQGTGYTETTSSISNSSVGRSGPGYEFFLAFWYLIFGHNLWAIWIVQSLIHAGSALLVYLIIKQLLDDSQSELFAALGAGFYIFFIDLLEMPSMILTETLYMFLILYGVHLSIKLWGKPTFKLTTGVTILFVLAVLIRPQAALLLVFTLGFLLWNRLYRHALVLIMVTVILMTPWTIRNYRMFNKFIPTGMQLGYNLWVGNSPDSKYVGEMVATKEIDKYAEEYGYFAANERGIQEVKNLVLRHPLTFLKLQLVKTSVYFSVARPAAFWFHLKGLSQLVTIGFSSLFALIVFIFGLAGFWRFVKKKDIVSRMFVLFTLAAPVGVIWTIVETRYRYQLYPFAIVLGIMFLAEFIKNKKELSRILLVSAILVTVNTLFDFVHNSARVIERLQRIW